jgi:hypothetical protein
MSDTLVGFDGLVQEVGKTPDIHLKSDGTGDVKPGIRSTNGKGIPEGEFFNADGDSKQNATPGAPNNWKVKP